MVMDRLDRSKIKNEDDLKNALNELNEKLQTEEERNKLRKDELLNLYIQFEKLKKFTMSDKKKSKKVANFFDYYKEHPEKFDEFINFLAINKIFAVDYKGDEYIPLSGLYALVTTFALANFKVGFEYETSK